MEDSHLRLQNIKLEKMFRFPQQAAAVRFFKEDQISWSQRIQIRFQRKFIIVM